MHIQAILRNKSKLSINVFGVLYFSCYLSIRGRQNETIGGWPLLTVETEHMGTHRVQMKGSFVGFFVGLAVQVQDIFFLPWLL